MNARKIGAAIVGLTAVLGACYEGIELPEPARMEKVGGDAQRATAGNRLALPFSVLITAADSTAVPREVLRWTVIEGDGASLSDSVTVTDGTGLARAYLTLGTSAGTYRVSAALERMHDAVVTFSATAVSAPVVTGLTPSVFTSGDQVSLFGSGLTDSTIVEFDGVQAAVAFASITGRGLSVFVPDCLVPGPVTVSVRIGLSQLSSVAGTYEASTAPLVLTPGEYLSVDPAALGGCATFPQVGGDTAEYLLAPQLATSTPGASVQFRLRGDSVVTALSLQTQREAERPIAARFDDFLRAQEAELAKLPRQPQAAAIGEASIQFDVHVGDRRRFQVCDTVTCRAETDFATVRAEAKYVGEHAVIYQDIEAPSGGFSPLDFNELGELFDEQLYGIATRAFGSESDVDRNGRLFILLTPIVNALTSKVECSHSFVTGFFFPFDIDPSAIRERDPRSNRAEVFYAIVPDPSGEVTCQHPVERVSRLVPVTFIHELQHMINFYQHVILRGGNSEQTWLNESMSHMAEELGGLHFEALGQQRRFTSFVLGDLYNAYQYLKDPSAHFLMYSMGTGTLEERGAGWLFLRWIVDQLGPGEPDVLRRLTETNLRGVENVEAATGESMSRLLADWFLANFMSQHPDLDSVPERLSYETWSLRDVYATLHEDDASLFDRPFPIEPMEFSGGGFDVSGTLLAGSGAYFRVILVAGQRGFTVQLVDADGNPLSGSEGARLNVIRIR